MASHFNHQRAAFNLLNAMQQFLAFSVRYIHDTTVFRSALELARTGPGVCVQGITDHHNVFTGPVMANGHMSRP